MLEGKFQIQGKYAYFVYSALFYLSKYSNLFLNFSQNITISSFYSKNCENCENYEHFQKSWKSSVYFKFKLLVYLRVFSIFFQKQKMDKINNK